MDAIQLNGFSLEILDWKGPVEKIIYRDSNYYSMPDGSEYKIRLSSSHNTKVDAHVWIDGEKIGVWRVNPHGRITIERPANVSRKFTLLKEGTINAIRGGIMIGSKDNGVIKVMFRPEMRDVMYGDFRHGLEKEYLFSSQIPMCNSYTDTVTPHNRLNQNCSMSAEEYDNKVEYGMTSAGTTLGKPSDQRFKRVTPLSDIDYDNITTIYTRLVVDNDDSTYRRKYIGLRDATRPYSNPQKLELKYPNRPHTCDRDSKLTLSDKYWFDSI